jgi:hypothetical protein
VPFQMYDWLKSLNSRLSSILRWNIYIILIDVTLTLLFSFGLGQIQILDLEILSTMLLIESAIFLFIGSSFELSSTVFFSKIREWIYRSKEVWSLQEYNRGRSRGSSFIILGFCLLLETFLVAFTLI